jgi:chemotaxis protein MotA
MLAGAVVLCTLIHGRRFSDVSRYPCGDRDFWRLLRRHTLIRFPLSSIFYGLPLGAKFAFSLRRMSQRDVVDELAGLVEVVRKQGPIGLEKVEIEDPFLAKGVRFVADGYDGNFIRDNLTP